MHPLQKQASAGRAPPLSSYSVSPSLSLQYEVRAWGGVLQIPRCAMLHDGPPPLLPISPSLVHPERES